MIGDVVTALRTGVDRLPFAELANALDAVEEARDLIDQAANGSSQDELHQVVDWFRQVADGIDELQRKLSAIQRDVTDIANRLEAIDLSAEPLVVSQAPPLPGPSASGVPPGNDLLAKLPERVGGKTSGIWVDEEGHEHTLSAGNTTGSRRATSLLNSGSALLAERWGSLRTSRSSQLLGCGTPQPVTSHSRSTTLLVTMAAGRVTVSCRRCFGRGKP